MYLVIERVINKSCIDEFIMCETEDIDEAKNVARYFDYCSRRDKSNNQIFIVEEDAYDEGNYDTIPYD